MCYYRLYIVEWQNNKHVANLNELLSNCLVLILSNGEKGPTFYLDAEQWKNCSNYYTQYPSKKKHKQQQQKEQKRTFNAEPSLLICNAMPMFRQKKTGIQWK